MQISVVGTGYVGLVTGACFADFGWSVTCIDRDVAKIQALEKGQVPFYEPGLSELVRKGLRKHTLSFTTQLKDAISKSDVVLIAVGTPSTDEGDADLSAVYEVVRQIAPFLKEGVIIVTKSTVPVGTSQELEKQIRSVNRKTLFHIASNPEFLREGSAIQDFMTPDRIVVGADTPEVIDRLEALYGHLTRKGVPFIATTCETSELIKYASNAFLAMKVSFINEIAHLCEKVGADVDDVAHGMGLDQRIGKQFLQAGPGYGGSCFPKDTQALVRTAQRSGTSLPLVETAIQSNLQTKQRMVEKIERACGGSLHGKTLAILGVTFKANTDDLRDSPSLTILPMLQERGAALRAYDPEGMEEGKTIFQGVTWCQDSYAAAKDSDGLVILTEWDAFSALDFVKLKEHLKAPLVVDLRNIYAPEDMLLAGFTYISIGRKDVRPLDCLSVTEAA
ncbi:MAG: UDP-glucose dehydrogenase family protein [Alphaproteobacteria bacterium]